MQGDLQRDFLQKTSRIANLFKKSVGPTRRAPFPVAAIPPIPQLNLSLPSDAEAELDDYTTPIDMRNALSTAISELQANYHQTFEKAYQRTLLQPVPQMLGMQLLGDALQKRFSTQAVPGLLKRYLADKAALPRPNEVGESKPKFNTEYVPYLEAYFVHNAYPSPHDREVMAKKSMMTSRQIEVWFQNHRRLEKKNGRPCVKRKASDAGPSETQIDRIELEMGPLGVTKEERCGTGTDAEREKWEYIQEEQGRGFSSLSAPRYPYDKTAIDILAMTDRPIPAFVPGNTPFLSGTAPTERFPPPTWTRQPATRALPHHATRPSFSELAERFAGALRIYSNIPRVSDESVPPAATCAITTRLEPGHLPALQNSPTRIEEARIMLEEAMKEQEAVLSRRPRPARSRSPEMQRQVSWSSASSGSEESLPATPQSTNVELELEAEPFDDLFDEEPVHEHDEVPLDIKGFVYADYPAPVAVGGKTRKKSHYRT
ncbi:hypothetical protein IW261DRAFT_1471930 [Armillaria novae-zelandiae]|uniref:Homeobox domain-containing protein n=1 Tax=Armillaria novae-zelandiae TaxID=153914 RepID=A0AA39UCL7_9AGAR|nr:hypothetical protein IW261DRAFT_1471930 [Armillaria novae-zelandiae]